MRGLALRAIGLALAASALATAPSSAQGAVTVGARDFRAVLTEAVAEQVGLEGDRVQVELAVDDAALIDSLQVRGAGEGRWIVTLWEGGSSSRRYVRVGVRREAPVAARDVRRGTEIAVEDVRQVEVVDWTGSRAPALDPVGMVATRALLAGEVLAEPAIRPPLLFNGGDEVEAVLEHPGVIMRVRAEALQSGRLGESVHVRLTSGKRMTGRAIARGVVQLTPGGA